MLKAIMNSITNFQKKILFRSFNKKRYLLFQHFISPFQMYSSLLNTSKKNTKHSFGSINRDTPKLRSNTANSAKSDNSLRYQRTSFLDTYGCIWGN